MVNLCNVPVKRMLVVALIVLIGCKDSDKNSSLIFEELNESLERSNKAIEASTAKAFYDLDRRKTKAETVEKAIYWGSKADTIKLITSNIIRFIDDLLVKLKESKEELPEKSVHDLYDRLKDYRVSVVNVERDIKREFEDKLPVFNNSLSASFVNKEVFRNTYFRKNVEQAKNSLIKIKNDLMVSENTLIVFCDNMSMPGCILNYTKFSAIAAANSTRLGVGDELIITAGIAEFTSQSKPKFTINGVKVKANEIGIGEYKMKVTNKPGKYKVHVKINFIMPDGQPNNFEKDIEYTVVE